VYNTLPHYIVFSISYQNPLQFSVVWLAISCSK